MRTLIFACPLLLAAALPAMLRAEDEAAEQRRAALDAIKDKLTTPVVELRYRFTAGETVRNKVTHLVTVETKIQGVTQTAKTRSVSTKSWHIKEIDKEGNITFSHSVEKVEMWQSVSGRQEVRYNSETDEVPPSEYELVAASIGQPLATVTIDPSGRVLNRKDERKNFNPGIGDLTVPLPLTKIRVGQDWTTPEEITLRLSDGRLKRVQTRQHYTLAKVSAGVATIELKTEVLTPLSDPRLESQLVQRLKTGKIRFDVDAGRVLSVQMDMDRTVVGFSGAESMMQYLARFSEEMVPPREARRPTQETQPK